MINVETVRRLLGAADATKQPYAVAEAAAALLAQNPSDAVAAAHYARALGALRLFGAAQRVLGGAALQQPTGIVRWASRARRFAANLAALESRDAQAAGLIREAAGGLERYELHASADGNFQILDTTLPLHAGWLGGLADQRASESLWQFDREKTPVPRPVAFVGLGFGWFFLKMLASTERSYLNYTCAVYILEPDAMSLAMLFHLHDLQEVLRQPRLRWFVRGTAEEALSAFREAVGNHSQWSLPGQIIRCPLRPSAAVDVEAVLAEVTQARIARRKELLAEAEAYYESKDSAWWARRYDEALAGTGAPLRVLGVTSRYTTVLQHSMAEMEQAVKGAGHEMQIAIERDDHSLESPWPEMLARYKPDLVFQISRLRYENEAMPGRVPFLCWDQDNLPCMRTNEARASLDDYTYVAGHGALHGYLFLNWPRRNVIFCESAGATFRYPGSPVSAELRASHACDVSFVSNASPAPEEMRKQQRQLWANDVHAAAVYEEVSALIIAQMDGGGSWQHHSLLREISRVSAARGVRLAPRWQNELILALTLLSDRCFRHAALQWVRQWCVRTGRTLRLYGQGWERHPDFAPYAAGYAHQGEALAAVYQASRINLHLMESGGFLHSRPLNGLAAGGFFLTRVSPNDGADKQCVEAQRTLAGRAALLGLSTRRDLDECADASVAAAWRVMKHFFTDIPPDGRITGLAVWNELPPASVIFPQLSKISFSTAAEFEERAEHFLANESERREIARAMQEMVRKEMSYSRRWKQFCEAVRDGLHASSPASPTSEAGTLVA